MPCDLCGELLTPDDAREGRVIMLMEYVSDESTERELVGVAHKRCVPADVVAEYRYEDPRPFL